MPEWLESESTHYIFHYKKNSYAHKKIGTVIKEQEQAILDILHFFPVTLPRKISYWLCDTREEIAELANDEPTNGLFCWDDDDTDKVSLYAVYNETMQCTGYHEETHAVTHFLNEPSSNALSEGIAVYIDKTWWGVAIDLCTYLYRLAGKYVSVEALICDRQEDGDEFFFSVDCAVSYPIMGAFVGFLLNRDENGKNTFLDLYAYEGDYWKAEIEKRYHCPFPELEQEFLNYINQKKYSEEEIKFGKERLRLE